MRSPEAVGLDETVEKECCGASTASALGLLRTSTIAAIFCHRRQLAARPAKRGEWDPRYQATTDRSPTSLSLLARLAAGQQGERMESKGLPKLLKSVNERLCELRADSLDADGEF